MSPRTRKFLSAVHVALQHPFVALAILTTEVLMLYSALRAGLYLMAAAMLVFCVLDAWRVFNVAADRLSRRSRLARSPRR